MNMYRIEYYNTELDRFDYAHVNGCNNVDAMRKFIKATNGTKIITECRIFLNDVISESED